MAVLRVEPVNYSGERDVKVRSSIVMWLALLLYHSKPALNYGDKAPHDHCAAHFQPEWWIFQRRSKSRCLQMIQQWTGFDEKQKPWTWYCKHWLEFIHFSATSDISNRLAHSSRKPASKSNDYMAMITMWLVQLHTISPAADCILHWSEDFQGSQGWDKLGHDKETDILSGPWTAIVIVWWSQSVRSSKVQMERRCLRNNGGENATWHLSKC